MLNSLSAYVQETDMIQTFNDLPLWAQAAAICLHGFVILFISLGFMQWLRIRSDSIQQLVPVAPFFVAVTAIFSLLLAFHGSSIWSKQDRAEKAMVQEEMNLQRFRHLSQPELLNQPALTHAVNQYALAVIQTEWRAIKTRMGTEATETALQRLRKTIINLDRDVSPAVHSYMLRLLDDLVRSREERLWLRAQPEQLNIWTVILLLGLLSNLAIVLVHLDKPKACRLSLLLFGTATSLAYWLLLSSEDPYQSLSTLESIALPR